MSRNHHYVRVSQRKEYRMVSTWIDTDNEVWAEPYHLYGQTERVNENWRITEPHQ